MFVDIKRAPGYRKSGVSVRLKHQGGDGRRGSTRINVRIAPAVAAQLGWEHGTRLAGRFGIGKDDGLLEISRNDETGNILRCDKPKSISMDVMFSAPWIPRLGPTHSKDLEPEREWRIVGASLVISLPAWARIPPGRSIDAYIRTP